MAQEHFKQGAAEDVSLRGKKILLALTGSIAVYKAVFLLRLLVKAGAEVQVLMTESARAFVQPLTFSALSGKAVLSCTHRPEDGQWHNHVELALWADLLVIAPLSAHTLSKMAQGQCDNLLLAVYLSARCPVLVAPAMDLDMYVHPSVQHNLCALKKWRHYVLEAEEGALASGLYGKGRLAEPETIFSTIETLLLGIGRFDCSRVLITAGSTQEEIDPVRFVGNRSSGKMGVAIAEAFAAEGASVDLVLGPSTCRPSHPRIKLQAVISAQEMKSEATKLHPKCQIAVFTAAVADYRPQQQATQKIKKQKSDTLSLTLVKNPDIALELGRKKSSSQFHIGFALETQNEKKNALEKLKKKHFDLLVMNSLQDPGAGFYHDTNKVSFFYKNEKVVSFPLKDKSLVAKDLLNAIYAEQKP